MFIARRALTDLADPLGSAFVFASQIRPRVDCHSHMRTSEFLERLSAFLPRFLGALPLALGIVAVTFLVSLVVGRALHLFARRAALTELDVLPIRRIARWLIWLIGAVLIVNVFGFEMGGVWAVLSTIFGLVAIGFVAVWSIISHTSATMIILLLQPFEIGDDLEFPGESVRGRVANLNFFFTTLVDHEGALYQIPNNLFFQKTVRRRMNRRVVSLAAQLHSKQSASVELPPPPRDTGSAGRRVSVDAVVNTPDPASISPDPRR